LAPGQSAFPYHYEHGREEWLFVLSGRPTLRDPDGEEQLEPGDLVVFPEGEDGAHKVTNNGDEPARIAMLSNKEEPSVAVYHDSARGVALCDIFRDDVDRRLFLARLRRIAGEHAWTCSLYCLMTTHFHLLIDTSLDQLSSGMHRLQGPYAQRFNRRYVRVG